MSLGSITPGEKYGYRKTRQLGAPVLCVEVIAKAKPGKWKVKFVDGPNAGLTDFVATGTMVVLWAQAEPFLNDEIRKAKVIEASDSEWSGDSDDTVAGAINAVLNSSGDWDSCLNSYGNRGRGIVEIPYEAAKRIARRAKLDPEPLKLDPLGFVDRFGNLVTTFNAGLWLAQAFARAEPDTVLTYIDADEREFMQQYGDRPYMIKAQAKDHAANHLAREWTEAPEQDRRANFELDELRREAATSLQKLSSKFSEIDQQKTEEIQRLRSLVIEATDFLRTAGADDKADKLLLSLNRPARPRR